MNGAYTEFKLRGGKFSSGAQNFVNSSKSLSKPTLNNVTSKPQGFVSTLAQS